MHEDFGHEPTPTSSASKGEIAHRIYASDLTPSPLGRVTLVAAITNGLGVQPEKPMRLYPDYAWVLITRGRGRYRDAHGVDSPVQAGDAILVLPSLAHMYGPDPHTRWDETYVVFNGPAFDAWRECGVLSADAPVRSLPTGRDWPAALRGLFDIGVDRPHANAMESEGMRETAPAHRGLQVCRLLALLTEALGNDGLERYPGSGALDDTAHASHSSAWAARAFVLLTDLDHPAWPLTEIAEQLNVSVETFRRHFRMETGQSPGRWRAERHIETACHWMMHTQLTNAQIATRLGFGDEFHFSRRFSQLRGMPPSEFRKRLRM